MISYDKDFYGWTQEQAAMLKAGRFNDLDIKNLIEEVEAMGRSEKRALQSRLAVLITHLLKFHYQASHASVSWRLTIDHQRIKFKKLLNENPGLKSELDTIFMDAYQDATYQAAKETNLAFETFPPVAPWPLAQCLDANFYPDAQA